MPKTIVIVGGYWSTNIGNSFFQLGAKYLFEKAFPNDRVVMLCDQPGYWNVGSGNPKNAFNLLDHIKPDYFVILGPFLRKECKSIWGKTMKILSDKKIKIIIIGAGMMRYDKEEIEICKSMLLETPPFIFASRDKETFDLFSGMAEHAFDGIDPAFFISDYYKPILSNIDKYVIFNFDQIPEPKVTVSQEKTNCRYCFKNDGLWWSFEFPELRCYLSKRFKAYPYFESFLPQIKYPDKIDKYLIIRTDHRFNPMLIRKAYRAANSFVSDLPYTYLNLYANAEAIFTNRVHAAVAALSYSRPAMLFSSSPRVRLLERVGLDTINNRLGTINPDNLQKEKDKLIDYVRKSVG